MEEGGASRGCAEGRWKDTTEPYQRMLSGSRNRSWRNGARGGGSMKASRSSGQLGQEQYGDFLRLPPKSSSAAASAASFDSLIAGRRSPPRNKSSSTGPDEDSSESSICEELDYNSSADGSEYSSWDRRGNRGGDALGVTTGMPPRSNSYNQLGILNHQGGMTRAQSLGSSLGSFGQYDRPGRRSMADNMRKVRSHGGTLSELAEDNELQRCCVRKCGTWTGSSKATRRIRATAPLLRFVGI